MSQDTATPPNRRRILGSTTRLATADGVAALALTLPPTTIPS